MKYTYLILTLIILLSACQSDSAAALDNMLRNQGKSVDHELEIIENAYRAVESSVLVSSRRSQIRAGVQHNYTIYSSNGLPVKIDYDLKGDTYTVKASYYIHDTIPYYINGTMRDQDIASGRYTHQELHTYLNGKKVIKQLRKTAVNLENRASDLSSIPTVDITKDIKQPDLDATLKYEEVRDILNML